MAEALICSDQELVPILFRSIQEGAILPLGPSTLEGRLHNVLRQLSPQRYRSSDRTGSSLSNCFCQCVEFVIEYRLNFPSVNTRKPLKELVDGRAGLEVLEQR